MTFSSIGPSAIVTGNRYSTTRKCLRQIGIFAICGKVDAAFLNQAVHLAYIDMCNWLAARGATGALDDLNAQKEARRAARRRQVRYEELLPGVAIGPLRAARSVDEIVRSLTDSVDDRVARAALYSRLFGCDFGTWNLYNGLDRELTKIVLSRALELLVRRKP
jgi:hypothetical protein